MRLSSGNLIAGLPVVCLEPGTRLVEYASEATNDKNLAKVVERLQILMHLERGTSFR